MTDVTVDFTFRLPGNPEAGAAEVRAAFAADPSVLAESYLQEGDLAMRCGAETAYAGDPLLYLIPAFCFDAVTGLCQSGQFAQSAWSSDQAVVIRRDGGSIIVSSEDFEPVSFPADELLQALYAAGERFMALMAEIWPEAAHEDRDNFRARAAAAKAALAG